jgi:hypothetical protein
MAVVVVQTGDHRGPSAVDHGVGVRDGQAHTRDHAFVDQDVADHPLDLCVAQHQVVRRRQAVVHTTTLQRRNCVLRPPVSPLASGCSLPPARQTVADRPWPPNRQRVTR